MIEKEHIRVDLPHLDFKQFLEVLRAQTDFQFEFVDKKYVIIKPYPSIAICVNIKDKESQEPLQGAFILHKNRMMQNLSDDNGDFRLSTAIAPTDSLEIRFLGYKPIKATAQDLSTMPCTQIEMEYVTTKLDNVVIESYLASGYKSLVDEHALEIDMNDLILVPGEDGGDILQTIKALPGINSPDSKAGNIYIRGSTPDQTLILFDDIPVYHKGHYFGTLSPYNPKVIDQLKVYRSGFHPRLGGRVGGAVDIRTSNDIPDSLRYGMAFSSVNAAAQMQSSFLNGKVGLIASGRTSYPFNWESLKLQAISEMIFQGSKIQGAQNNPELNLNAFDFHFHDINTKLVVKPNVSDKFLVSFLNVDNDLNFTIEDVAAQNSEIERLRLRNSGLNAKWIHEFSEKFESRLSITGSRYEYTYKAEGFDSSSTKIGDYWNFNSVEDIGILSEFNYFRNNGDKLNFGYNGTWHKLKYQQWNIDSGLTTLSQDVINDGLIHSAFANYSWRGHDKFKMNTGVRVNYFTSTQNWNVEPRIFLNYDVNKKFFIKGSFGLYNQYLTQVLKLNFEDVGLDNQPWTLSDQDIPHLRGLQSMLGMALSVKGWVFDVEAYIKDLQDVATTNSTATQGFSVPFFFGELYSTGIDFLVKKSWGRLETWLTYTLSRTRMQFDSLGSQHFFAYYDQPHVFNFFASYKHDDWRISAGWKWMSGLSTQLGQPTPTVMAGFNERFPPLHQLDISMSYRFSPDPQKWVGTIGLSILNVYNQQNLVDFVERQEASGTVVVNRYAIGFAPNVQVSFDW